MEDDTYAVYLVENESEASVESPVRTDVVDYYDSGVWLDREEGRVFFPYEQVRMIEQRPAAESEDQERDQDEYEE